MTDPVLPSEPTAADRPMVSVVVPVKDSIRTIEACLRSIRAQTWEPLELVVIDNFSTDDTWEVVQELATHAEQAGPDAQAAGAPPDRAAGEAAGREGHQLQRADDEAGQRAGDEDRSQVEGHADSGLSRSIRRRSRPAARSACLERESCPRGRACRGVPGCPARLRTSGSPGWGEVPLGMLENMIA